MEGVRRLDVVLQKDEEGQMQYYRRSLKVTFSIIGGVRRLDVEGGRRLDLVLEKELEGQMQHYRRRQEVRCIVREGGRRYYRRISFLDQNTFKS